MNIQFDYQPFDRVTAMINERPRPAVFFQDYSIMAMGGRMDFLEVAYVDPGGQIRDYRVGANEIRPGHYDVDGNWTPKPGDPCYMIVESCIVTFTIVGPAKQGRIVAIDNKSLDLAFFEVFGDKAIETCSLSDDEVGHDIPESCILRPGRPKFNKQ